MTDLRCKICDRLIDPKRLARYPHSTTCGGRECFVENRRRVHNSLALRLKRARAAKKEPALREPPAHARPTLGTVLSSIHRAVSGAVARAARAVWACRPAARTLD